MRGMDRIRSGVIAAVAMVAVAAPAGAQDIESVCGALGGEHGEWAEFKMEGPSAAQVSKIKVALVDRGDPQEMWFELSAETVQGPQIVQLQVPGFPFGASDVKAGIVQAMTMPPMLMPDQMLSMMQQQMQSNPMFDITKQCRASEIVGEESVSVPAGEMKAWRIKGADGRESWVTGDVPFGVVKGSGGATGADTMILTAYGTDATSSITGDPQPMPAMPGMPPQD